MAELRRILRALQRSFTALFVSEDSAVEGSTFAGVALYGVRRVRRDDAATSLRENDPAVNSPHGLASFPPAPRT